MIINMNGAKAPETPSPVLQEKTVTPETLPTVIGADEGYDGLSQVTVNPDSQLIPTNIRSGKTIFGVEGSFVGTPSGELDYNKIGIGNSYTYGYTLAIGYPPVIEENPTRLTELGFTSQKYHDSAQTESDFIEYGTGLIACRKSKAEFPSTISSYVPSVTNYKWYYKSGTIPSGDMKFYIQNAYASSVTNATHIIGEGYLYPVLHITYGSYFPIQPNIEVRLIVPANSEIATPVKTTVDTALVDSDITGSPKMFTLNVPEITFESYGYINSSYTASKLSLTYIFIPSKIVIS